jgi:pyridoxal phosphate enzyme (YggS family)
MAITNNFQIVECKVREYEKKYSRKENAVSLVAVSKRRPEEAIELLYHQGHRHFGENYLQEALPKIQNLSKLKVIWHFIGKIQANKTAEIAINFDWVQTLDRPKIATRLNAQRPAHKEPLNILIQINSSGEDSKSGINIEELPALVKLVDSLPRLKLQGVMAMPAPHTNFDQQRMSFSKIMSVLQTFSYDLPVISFGTSSDFEAAIAEGSTMVRLGNAIFGPREA